MGWILHKCKGGLFCQDSKQGQLDKTLEKGSNTSKIPSCHLAREITGLQPAAYEQVPGENESEPHKNGREADRLQL